MAKLFQFSVFCILQLYSLSLNIPPLYAKHLCSHDQNLSLLKFKGSVQIINYRETCTSEFGLYGMDYIDHYCDRNFNRIIGAKISSWNSSTDCCSWEGVTCDEFTGNVVELDLSFSYLTGEINSNSTIFQLSHLKRLNLAYNFLESEISPEFRRFAHLSHLNLSNTGFAGQIPSEISQLNELVSLDLSDNYSPILKPHVFKLLLQNMSKLRELYLEGVNITSSLPNNLSSSLTILDLAYTNLKGAFPYHIFHLPNLQQLSLGHNSFDGFGSLTRFIWNTSSSLWKLELPQISISKELLDTIGNLKHLEYLDLSYCDLNGTLRQSFGNLTLLSHLDLSHNNFSGEIPQGIFGLEHLTLLDIGSNNLDAPIPHSSSNSLSLKVLSVAHNKLTTTCVSSFLNNLTQLENIDLSFNPLYEMPLDLFELSFLQKINLKFTHLHGPIPQSFSNLVNLKYLNLESNQLSGPIKIDTFSNNLMYLNLASNNFTGPIEMHAFSKLVNLKYFNLASNNFNGPIEIDAFSNLVNLITLDLSSNNFGCDLDLRFLSNIKWMDGLNLSFSGLSLAKESKTTLPMISIRSLLLDSCNIRDLDVLRSIVVVEDLHLSNNNIHGEIPEWAWSNWSNITFLDLSNNFITHIDKIPLQSLRELDIGSNLLQGELPDLPHNIWTLSLSNNQLHGEIKSTICEREEEFAILDLSNNSLTGALPDCISNAAFLDLHMNNLNGTIPDTFSMKFVESLNLRSNHLEGRIPPSLISVSYLGFLDLSENNLTDAFPVWLANLPLRYLSLRSNKLYGPISSSHASKYAFSGLQILDISSNRFNGHFPARLLKGLEVMMSASDTSNYDGIRFGGLASQQYYSSMTMVINGNTIQLDRISDAMKIIDISCNYFEGEIPSSIGDLVGIQQLNLSHNNFTGQIPPQLGNLSNLQSLGLSHNLLDGNIPRQLADLGFLSVLNLSYNHLTGQIPTGRQLQTIPNDSYIGNDGLCGFPLSRKCGNDNAVTKVEVSDEEDHQEFFDGFTWQSIMVGYGVGICIGFVIGIIMLFNEKPKWLIKVVMEEAQRIGYKYKTRNGISWNITS